jgi:hypothetical protein
MPITTPTITPIVNTASGNIAVNFSNGGATLYNRLRRNGILIGATIPDDDPDPDVAVFLDYQTRSGEQVSYIGSSIDASGNESFPTAPITATLNLSSAWLHQVAKNTNGNIGNDFVALELFNLEGQSQKRAREGNVLRLAAVEKPRIKTAPQIARTIECPILIRNEDRTAVMPILEAILWSNDLFCFRNQDGELMFCTIDSPQETSTNLNVEMVLKLTESAYSEAIL